MVKKIVVPDWLEIYMEDDYTEIYDDVEDITLELYSEEDDDEFYYDEYDEDWYPKQIGEVDDYDSLLI